MVNEQENNHSSVSKEVVQAGEDILSLLSTNEQDLIKKKNKLNKRVKEAFKRNEMYTESTRNDLTYLHGINHYLFVKKELKTTFGFDVLDFYRKYFTLSTDEQLKTDVTDVITKIETLMKQEKVNRIDKAVLTEDEKQEIQGLYQKIDQVNPEEVNSHFKDLHNSLMNLINTNNEKYLAHFGNYHFYDIHDSKTLKSLEFDKWDIKAYLTGSGTIKKEETLEHNTSEKTVQDISGKSVQELKQIKKQLNSQIEKVVKEDSLKTEVGKENLKKLLEVRHHLFVRQGIKASVAREFKLDIDKFYKKYVSRLGIDPNQQFGELHRVVSDTFKKNVSDLPLRSEVKVDTKSFQTSYDQLKEFEKEKNWQGVHNATETLIQKISEMLTILAEQEIKGLRYDYYDVSDSRTLKKLKITNETVKTIFFESEQEKKQEPILTNENDKLENKLKQSLGKDDVDKADVRETAGTDQVSNQSTATPNNPETELNKPLEKGFMPTDQILQDQKMRLKPVPNKPKDTSKKQEPILTNENDKLKNELKQPLGKDDVDKVDVRKIAGTEQEKKQEKKQEPILTNENDKLKNELKQPLGKDDVDKADKEDVRETAGTDQVSNQSTATPNNPETELNKPLEKGFMPTDQILQDQKMRLKPVPNKPKDTSKKQEPILTNENNKLENKLKQSLEKDDVDKVDKEDVREIAGTEQVSNQSTATPNNPETELNKPLEKGFMPTDQILQDQKMRLKPVPNKPKDTSKKQEPILTNENDKLKNELKQPLGKDDVDKVDVRKIAGTEQEKKQEKKQEPILTNENDKLENKLKQPLGKDDVDKTDVRETAGTDQVSNQSTATPNNPETELNKPLEKGFMPTDQILQDQKMRLKPVPNKPKDTSNDLKVVLRRALEERRERFQPVINETTDSVSESELTEATNPFFVSEPVKKQEPTLTNENNKLENKPNKPRVKDGIDKADARVISGTHGSNEDLKEVLKKQRGSLGSVLVSNKSTATPNNPESVINESLVNDVIREQSKNNSKENQNIVNTTGDFITLREKLKSIHSSQQASVGQNNDRNLQETEIAPNPKENSGFSAEQHEERVTSIKSRIKFFEQLAKQSNQNNTNNRSSRVIVQRDSFK